MIKLFPNHENHVFYTNERLLQGAISLVFYKNFKGVSSVVLRLVFMGYFKEMLPGLFKGLFFLGVCLKELNRETVDSFAPVSFEAF